MLLRHGELTFIVEGRFQGAADSPLSPLGEQQAALAAARLADPGRSPALPIPPMPPLEIVHSPLGRAAATARAVGEAIAAREGPVPIRAEAGLAEIGQGRWEGTHRSQIEAEDGDVLSAWRREPLVANAPGGERVLDAAVRVREALGGVVARLAEAGRGRIPGERPPAVAGYPGAAVADAPWTLLVAHDGIFKVALLTLLDLPLDRFWTFPFALCGITVVELRDGRASSVPTTSPSISLHWPPRSRQPRPDRPAPSEGGLGGLARACETALELPQARPSRGVGMRGRIGRWSIICVVLAAALSACAADVPPLTADPGTDWVQVKAQSALTRWATAVAASRDERAFVQVGDPTGQVGDWEEAVGQNNKPAVMSGLVEVIAGDIPAEKPPDGEVLWADGTRRTVSLSSALDAVSALRGLAGGDCPGCVPVRLTGARLTTGQVDTSHGPATVPIWEFTVKGSAVRLTRVAVDAATSVVLPPMEPIGAPFSLPIGSATGRVDGLELTVTFIGARDGADKPCGVDYSVEAVESATAIVVILSSRNNPTPAACTLMGFERTAVAKLAAPLGDRAVLNVQDGAPIPVVLTP